MRAAILPFCLAVLVAGCEETRPALPLVGTLERDRLELIAEANEQIVETMVAEGDHIRAGDTVLRLESTIRGAELGIVEAQLEAARQRLAELVRGPRQERIREARARLAGAQENLVIRSNELTRVSTLVDRGLASEADLDRARNAREGAEADVDALTAGLDELLEGTTTEEIAQAEARVDEAGRRVELARIAVERLTLRAPRDGRVDALPYELGERPPAGATVAVLLADQAPYARVYVPEPLRAAVVPGLTASVSVDGVDQPFAGTVRYVSSEPVFTPYFSLTQRDRSRLAYLTEVTVDDPGAANLPVGVPVEVDFPTLR
jgi:HlyD family secretion protein